MIRGLAIATAIAVVAVVAVSAISAPPAAAADLSKFDAGNIISDEVFYDAATMTESDIQSFFRSKVSSCRDGHVCLINYRADTVTREATTRCARYEGAADESAARIVYKVAQACNINPRVLIVMLQKEQGLVTKSAPGTWEWLASMGYGCPDTAPCETQYYGFYNQVYLAAAQMQRYTQSPNSWNYRAGRNNSVQYHPNSACGSSSVYIDNQATANLYIYTPYQPNAAALAAGYGVGNSCSSYGNRNFYNYFIDWFGSTQASATACTIAGGPFTSETRQVVTTAVLNARKAPTIACMDDVFQLAEGTVVQALRSTASGDWVEVRTVDGARWVSSDFVRDADEQEALCALPAGTSATDDVFVVTTATSLKIAPWEACELRSTAVDVGAVVQATRVSYTGNWLQVQTQAGPRWLLRSAVSDAEPSDIEAVCVDPAGTSATSGQYVLRGSAVAWQSPLARCGAGETFGAGSVFEATRVSYTGNWIEVQTQAGLRWVSRSAMDVATAADVDAACVGPAGTSATSDQYVLSTDATLWASPFARCAAGSTVVGAGTVVQATRVSYTGNWLEVQTSGGPRWLRSDAVELCADPAGTRSASRQYVLREATSVLVSPLATCGTAAAHWGTGTDPLPVGVGTVVQATRISYTGNWLEIQTSRGPRWIRTSAIAVCPEPAATRRATLQYVVLSGGTSGLVSPLAECGTAAAHWGTGTAPVTLGTGTVLQATRVSYTGTWLEVQTSAGPRWIRRADVAVR